MKRTYVAQADVGHHSMRLISRRALRRKAQVQFMILCLQNGVFGFEVELWYLLHHTNLVVTEVPLFPHNPPNHLLLGFRTLSLLLVAPPLSIRGLILLASKSSNSAETLLALVVVHRPILWGYLECYRPCSIKRRGRRGLRTSCLVSC